MGASVTKFKQVTAVTNFENGQVQERALAFSKKSSSLERVADDFMKNDSYKRSHAIYGVDLTEETADDEPLDQVQICKP